MGETPSLLLLARLLPEHYSCPMLHGIPKFRSCGFLRLCRPAALHENPESNPHSSLAEGLVFAPQQGQPAIAPDPTHCELGLYRAGGWGRAAYPCRGPTSQLPWVNPKQDGKCPWDFQTAFALELNRVQPSIIKQTISHRALSP